MMVLKQDLLPSEENETTELGLRLTNHRNKIACSPPCHIIAACWTVVQEKLILITA
jgi:hypothetical protein